MVPELIHFSKSPILEVSVFWIFLFIPAFLLGGSFPVLNGIFLNNLEKGIKDTGKVYFFDTLGAAIGSIVAGFYLLPKYGIDGTIHAGIFFNFVFLTLVFIFQKQTVNTILLICAIFFLYINDTFYQKPDHSMDKRFGEVLFQENSDYGVITVGLKDKMKGLYINYRSMCYENTEESTPPKNISSNFLSVETGDNLLSRTSKILNIGLGCGLTAKYLSLHPNVSELDVVEINPVVYKAADQYFSKENDHITKKKDVNIIIQNGVDYIERTEKKYDAVVIDIEEVSVIYSSALYTAEYMEKIKSKLSPHGIFSLWSFNIGPEFTKVLKNTASKVFKNVEIQYFPEAINLYASDRKLNISSTKEKATFSPAVDRLNLTEINTLGNHTLEKYYNSNKNFALPSYYKEKFVRE